MLALILFADDGQTLFKSIVALSFVKERKTLRLSDDVWSLKLLVSSRSVVAARKSFHPDKEENIETGDRLRIRDIATMMIRLTLVRKVEDELGLLGDKPIVFYGLLIRLLLWRVPTY